MIDEKKCLKNLLEDMDDIEEKLSKWTGKTNIFQEKINVYHFTIITMTFL
ncbi:hypothetical protein ACT6P1_12305 [Enterococcus lactis]